VDNVSFRVEKARCFGLLGPNGAGKTTLIKILYGKTKRDKPLPGKQSLVNVFGYDPLQNELEIKYLSGIVPQEDNLDLELSVIQNLLIYARFYGLSKRKVLSHIESLLEFMELSDKINSKIRELSGGMKRRLIIARALINNPQLLILDEPTTGLDPQVRHIIWDKLRKLLKEGVTIIITTHYMEEAFQICDRLIIMHKGKKILEGIPQNLVSKNMEPYVLELYNPDPDHFSRNEFIQSLRMEITDSRILLYSDALEPLQKITKKYPAGQYYLRQSNLEDLFLKATGRKLNE
jgi:lipooligosaccharide transport system ATP-binding protein